VKENGHTYLSKIDTASMSEERKLELLEFLVGKVKERKVQFAKTEGQKFLLDALSGVRNIDSKVDVTTAGPLVFILAHAVYDGLKDSPDKVFYVLDATENSVKGIVGKSLLPSKEDISNV
jgi:hypothetical protein